MQSWTFLLLTKLCKSYEIAKPKCVCQQFRCDFVVRCHYYYKLRTSLWNDYPNILKTFERHTSMTHFPFFSLETKLRSNCQIENFFGENIKAENWELTKKKETLDRNRNVICGGETWNDHDATRTKKTLRIKIRERGRKDRFLKRIINGYCQWLLIKWAAEKREKRGRRKSKSFRYWATFLFDYERLLRVGLKTFLSRLGQAMGKLFRVTNLYILCSSTDENGHFNDLFILVS